MKAKWIIYWLGPSSNAQLPQPVAMNIHLDLIVFSVLNWAESIRPPPKLHMVISIFNLQFDD